MDVGTLEAVVVLALGAMPGVVVLFLLELGRPPLQLLDRLQTLVVYLILSAGAWALAVVLLGAEDVVLPLLELEFENADLALGHLGSLLGRLVAAALILGVMLRVTIGVATRVALNLSTAWLESAVPRKRRMATRIADLISPSRAWDRLLVRVQRTGQAQVVSVQLKDGGQLYGAFAGSGHADWDKQGRGLLLDTQLVEIDGGLIDLEGSTGVYVDPSAIASVSFVSYPAEANQDER